ncbi:glycosyl hydrolase family 65 protein, partial [uncultured Bifidobacterium sp.]
KEWDSLSYQLTVGETRFRVMVTPDAVGTEHLAGPEITVKVQGHPRQV